MHVPVVRDVAHVVVDVDLAEVGGILSEQLPFRVAQRALRLAQRGPREELDRDLAAQHREVLLEPRRVAVAGLEGRAKMKDTIDVNIQSPRGSASFSFVKTTKVAEVIEALVEDAKLAGELRADIDWTDVLLLFKHLNPALPTTESRRAELRAARERVQLLRAGPRPDAVTAARAQVVQAQAAITLARARLAERSRGAGPRARDSCRPRSACSAAGAKRCSAKAGTRRFRTPWATTLTACTSA